MIAALKRRGGVTASLDIMLPAPPAWTGPDAITAVLAHDEATNTAVDILARLHAAGWQLQLTGHHDGGVAYRATGHVIDDRAARIVAMSVGAGHLALTLTPDP